MAQRILFTIENLYPAGPALQLKGLVKELIESELEIHVAVLGQRSDEPERWAQIGATIHFLNPDDSTPLHTLRDGYYVTRELRQLISSIRPDIVHAWCGLAELITLFATEDYPLGSSVPSIRLFSTELYQQPEKKFVRQLVENRMGERIEKMFVPHESVESHLLENGYRAGRIRVVKPGLVPASSTIETGPARSELREKLELQSTDMIAGTVASLHHRTRLKDLIWATDLLTCIRDDFHFVIVGEGPQYRRLRRFAALTEAFSHVHFLDRSESPEQVIAGLDFYWHAHLRHPLSGVVMQAMSMNVPVISVYGEGMKELIQPQVTAMGVNFGARDEFARWTKYLIEHRDSSQQLANQGREFVRSEFKIQTMAQQYLEAYQSSPVPV